MEFLNLAFAIFNCSGLLVLPQASYQNQNTSSDQCNWSTPSLRPSVTRHRYSVHELRNLKPVSSTRLPPGVLISLRNNNICISKKTKRGRRGGQKKIKVHITSNYLNNKNYQRTACISNLIKIKPTPKPFSFLLLNCQSVGDKELLLNDLVFNIKPDIAFFTETWLSDKGDEVRITDLTPPTYVPDNFSRLTGLGGGILILNKNSTTLSTERITGQSTFECTKSKIIIHNSSFIVFCIYRPPPSQTNQYKPSVFILEFNDFLDKYLPTNDQFLILGDFNLHFDCPSDTYVKQMLNLLIPRNLKQIINKPTQRAGHILDWVVTEDSSIISDVNIVDKAISDQSVITFNINKYSSSSNKRVVHCRNIKGINCGGFKCDIGQCNLELRGDQERADYFNTFVQGVVDKHAPLRKRTVTDRASAPWMNADIKKIKSERRATERKWRKTGSTVDKNIFKCFNYKVKQCMQTSKRFFFESKISTSKSSKSLFNVVNELYGKSKCLKLPSNLPVFELADKFSSFFINKISCIREQLDLTCVSNPFLSNLCSNKMNVFKHVTTQEVKEIILSSPSKSCTLDPLPTTLLKVYIYSLIEPITEIINCSLSTGVVTSCFKHALVMPLLKKSTLDPNVLSNFRPV